MAGLGHLGPDPSGLANRPITGGSGSAARQLLLQAATDSHRLDPAGESVIFVGLEQYPAQSALALGDLRSLARHLGDKAAHHRALLQPDHRIIVTAHPGIGLIGGAARQNLGVGRRYVAVRPEYGRDAAVDKMAEGHLLARRLGMKIDEDRRRATTER